MTLSVLLMSFAVSGVGAADCPDEGCVGGYTEAAVRTAESRGVPLVTTVGPYNTPFKPAAFGRHAVLAHADKLPPFAAGDVVVSVVVDGGHRGRVVTAAEADTPAKVGAIAAALRAQLTAPAAAQPPAPTHYQPQPWNARPICPTCPASGCANGQCR